MKKDLNYLYARAQIMADEIKNKDKNVQKDPPKPMKEKAKKWYLTILVFLIVFGITLHTNKTYDGYWHYKVGEYIVQNHEIPKEAIFSWYGLENNLEWISHEWLFEVLIYLLASIFGFNSIPILSAIITGSLLALITYINFENIKGSPIKIIALAMFVGLMLVPSTIGRPQIILNWLIMCSILLMSHELKNPDNKIWLLVPIMLLWVNVHGGSWILLPFFLLIMILCNCFEFKYGRLKLENTDRKTKIKRLFVLLVCLVMVGVNPHGLKMYLYPFTNASDTTMLKYITEWAPLTFNNLSNLLFLVLPIIYFVPFVFRRDEISIFELLVICAFTFMTFISIRFSTQLTIISFYMITKYIFFKEEKKMEFSYKWIVQLLIIYLAYTGGVNSRHIYKNAYDTSEMPSETLVETIKQGNFKRLYNSYNSGGYLIYNGIETFIDGRADIYSKDNFEDYASITTCEYKFEEKLAKYNFDALLVERDKNLFTYLSEQRNYELVAKDDNYGLFVLKSDNNDICNTKGC